MKTFKLIFPQEEIPTRIPKRWAIREAFLAHELAHELSLVADLDEIGKARRSRAKTPEDHLAFDAMQEAARAEPADQIVAPVAEEPSLGAFVEALANSARSSR